MKASILILNFLLLLCVLSQGVVGTIDIHKKKRNLKAKTMKKKTSFSTKNKKNSKKITAKKAKSNQSKQTKQPSIPNKVSEKASPIILKEVTPSTSISSFYNPISQLNEKFESPQFVKKLSNYGKAQVEFMNDPKRKLLNTVENLEAKTTGGAYIDKPIFSGNVIESSLTNIQIPQYSISSENKLLWQDLPNKRLLSVEYPNSHNGDLHQGGNTIENNLKGVQVHVELVGNGNPKALLIDEAVDQSFNGVTNSLVDQDFYETKNESTYLPNSNTDTNDFKFDLKAERSHPETTFSPINAKLKAANMRFIMVN